ncbi:MAG TPA: glycoside hydrolase family 3 N-terminal domain-containing protein [Candidatus Paceibacterota bacterium]|nr:glycoside hydrolase family 3 N-terminal domain-containing protein [Candidatus Paceibacterota bacterium]
MENNPQPEENKEEMLEFLKRGEAKTMQRDLAKLREGEAEKEKTRVAALGEVKKEVPTEKPGVLLPRESAALPKEAAAEEAPRTLIPQTQKPSSSFKKILIRISAVVIILLLIGFFYWLFTVGKLPKLEIAKPETEIVTEATPTEEVIEEPKIVIPVSLISAGSTETMEITNIAAIPQLLSQIMQKTYETEGYTRILFQNTAENKIVGLNEFLGAFAVKIPEEVSAGLEDDFTLFVYSSKGINRLGFMTKTKGDISHLMISWEMTMEADTETLFAALGKETKALASSFKNSSYLGKTFRFLTISKEDFGICYTLLDDYFIFTTSFESMKKTFEAVDAAKLGKQIGQLFIVGFDGTALTTDLADFFKKYKPGGVLLLSKNIENEEQLKKLIGDLQILSLQETGLPLFIAVDQEGGAISRIDFLQEKTAQSEIESVDQAFQIGSARGQELKELGINLNLAPLLDQVGEEDFLFDRTFEKDALTSGNLAKSFINGQKGAGILTAMKHFPGYSGVTSNPEESLAETSTLPVISQFKKAMQANPEFVITANMVYTNLDSSIPFAFSSKAIQYLKNNLGSKVIIMTDDLAQTYLSDKFSLKDIVTKPIEAGADVMFFSGWEIGAAEGLDAFAEAFRNGEISKDKVEAAILKIINVKNSLM